METHINIEIDPEQYEKVKKQLVELSKISESVEIELMSKNSTRILLFRTFVVLSVGANLGGLLWLLFH